MNPLGVFFKEKYHPFSGSISNVRIFSFSVLYHCNLNIFDFYTVGRTNQAIIRCHIVLTGVFHYFLMFCRLSDELIDNHYINNESSH